MICVCISTRCTLWKLLHLSPLFTAYPEFDTFIPLSSSNGYIVFHVTLCIPARIAEKTISVVFRQSSPPLSSLPLLFSPSPVILYPSPGPRRSFAARARRGTTNDDDHEFREPMWIGVVLSHIGRRFPTLRQYGQVPRQSFCAYLHPVASQRYTYVDR